MGSKGSNASQTTNQTQTYRAAPEIKAAGRQAITGAQSAAAQPFQMPVAPVAGFNPFQQQSFDQVQDMQGQWQPYVNAARSYYDQSAAPITGADVDQYYNPMASSVFEQLAQQQGQQWKDVTGKLTGAAGGVGAERIAVGQGQLANQQRLASGQIAAGLYQQALQAAQQQKQMSANAGAGMLQTGAAGQTGALRDIATLGQAGLQQQQQSQSELNAPYQNRLAEIAYPFQTAQYLAGITGGLAPAFGGTTSGQSTTTYQPAQAPAWQQAVGLGMQGLGMAMGMPTIPGMGSLFGGGGGATFGGAPGQSGMGSWGGTPFPIFGAERGGRIEAKAEGGEVEAPQAGVPSAISARTYVPRLNLPMGAGHSGPLTGGINIQHAKIPEQKDQSAAGTASKAMSSLGSLVGNREDYEPETEARGGSVFPKHFYTGGGEDSYSPSDGWFLGGPEAVNTGPGIGIPGVDFAPDDKDIPAFKSPPQMHPDTSKWGDPTGGGAAAAFPASPKVSSQGAPASWETTPKAPPSPDDFNQNSGWLSRRLFGDTPSAPKAIGDESAGLNMTSPFPQSAAPPAGIPAPQQAAAPAAASVAMSTNPADYPVFPRAGENDAYDEPQEIHPYGAAIAKGESGGRYDAVGKPHPKTGDRAWGKYQVMGANIGPWTEKYVGQRMTPRQFLESPEAQEKVFAGEFGRLQERYGPSGAARAWFAGEGGMNDPDRKDVLGTTVAEYERRFNAASGDGPTEGSAASRRYRSDFGEPGEASRSRYGLPRTMQPYPDATDRNWGQKMARSPWMSLVKAGAVVANTPGGFGSALSKGIAAGLDQLQGERGQLRQEETMNQRAKQLHQTAQHYLDQYERMTPYQRESLENQRDSGRFTPYNYIDAEGKPRVGVMNTKTGDLIDPITRQPVAASQLTRPGGTGSGASGGDTALIKNMKYLVSAGIASDEKTAYARLREAATNRYQRAEIIRKFVETARKDPNNATRKDNELYVDAERKVDEMVAQTQAIPTAPAAAAAPAASDHKVGDEKEFSLGDGKKGKFKKIKAGPDSDRSTWEEVKG